MKLSYRGIEYDYNPAFVETAETDRVGRYRGQAFSVAYPKHIPVPQPVLSLKYRGVAYRTTPAGGVENLVPVSAVVPGQTALPMQPIATLQARRAKLSELARVHRDNIQRNLQHRLEVAKAKGDQSLIHQLEQEMRQLV